MPILQVYGLPEADQATKSEVRDNGMTIWDRFMAKVSPEPNSGCWLWMGHVNWGGYGMAWDGKRLLGAHRMAYRLLRGDIPTGLHLDHLCRVRSCVNPDHLEPVTNRENARRGDTGKNMSIKTHCPTGHAYDSENTIITAIGSRACRKCSLRRARDSKRRARHRKKQDALRNVNA